MVALDERGGGRGRKQRRAVRQDHGQAQRFGAKTRLLEDGQPVERPIIDRLGHPSRQPVAEAGRHLARPRHQQEVSERGQPRLLAHGLGCAVPGATTEKRLARHDVAAAVDQFAAARRIDPQEIPVTLVGQGQVGRRLLELLGHPLPARLAAVGAGVAVVDGQRRLRLRAERHGVAESALHVEVDLVVAHVGIDGHQEVAGQALGQAAVPAVGRQRRGKVGVAQEDGQVPRLNGRRHVARQPDGIDRAEIRLQLGHDGRGETAQERFAVGEPLPHLLALLDVARLAQGLQQVAGVERLIRSRHGHGAGSVDEEAQELLIDGDGPIEGRRVLAVGVEIHRLLGRGGEVGPVVGVAEEQHLQAHVVVIGLGREVVRLLGPIVDPVGVAELEVNDLPVLDDQHARAGQEATGGAYLVLVLGHDQVAARPIGSQQGRRVGQQPQPAPPRRQPLVR